MSSQASFIIRKCGTNRQLLSSHRLLSQQPKPSSSSSLGRFNKPSMRLMQTTTAQATTPALSVLMETVVGHYSYYNHLHNNFHRDDGSSQTTNNNNRILSCSPITSTDSQLDRCLQYARRWLRALWNACLVTQRITEVVVRLSPLAVLAPTAYLSGSHKIAEWAWSYGVHAVQRLGPVAVKFGQWVATRRDIFPPKLCDRLAVLHDQGYPHSWEYTDRILTEAFGDYEQKGLQIEQVIGCGSAAQVYKGKLLTIKEGDDDENNAGRHRNKEERTVAIKVLHPNFTKLVERDLELIQIVADYLHSLPSDLIRMLNLPRATENFGSVLRLQADLTNEAKNLKRFRFNFYKNRGDVEEKSSIAFPEPLEDWKTANVLVEDFVHDAVPIAEFLNDSTEEGLELRRELAGPLLRAFLKMVFMDNFVHGDLHPGNVLVKTSKVKASHGGFWSFGNDADEVVKHSIVFLDAGIANSLSPEDKRNLKDLFQAVIFNDGNQAGRLMVERAKYERCSSVPGGVDAFAKGVEDIVSEFHGRRKAGLTLGAVRIGSLLSRVLDLCRVHGVEIDPNMASVVLSTLVLEGLGRSLAPELNLIDFAKPFVLGLGKV